MRLIPLVFIALVYIQPVQARVFDLGKETFASYFLMSSGASTIAQSAYTLESSAVSFDNAGVATNASGEFGFVYTNKTVSWRFGFEVLTPTALKAVSGLNAGGATLYSLNSSISGYFPKLGLEINFRHRPDSRFFIFGYTGTLSLTVTNAYSGLTIAPNADFSYIYKGSCMAAAGGIGYELSAFDTTSMVIEVGTRSMEVLSTTYGADATGFSNVTSGSAVTKSEGSPRSFDLSGIFYSLGFRFYLK